MILGRVGSGCMGCFGVALLIHACVLPLIGLLVLTGWGAILLVTAHAVRPMATTAVVVDATDWFKGATYQHTAITLRGDPRNYRVVLNALQPPVPQDRPRPGERATLWFDPDIDWGNVSETHVLALSLAEEQADQAAHRLADFDNPESTAMRQRLVGAGVLGVVALIIGLGGLWEWFSTRRPHDPYSIRIT